MKLERSRGPVAAWHFHGPPVTELSYQALQRLLATCRTVGSILAGKDLLLPHRIQLSRWMRAGQHGVAAGQRVERPNIELTAGAELLSEVGSAAQAAMRDDSVYPLTIEVSGAGVVRTPAGEIAVDDLIWLRAITLDTFLFSINTQSDVWLPFSLQGKDQREIWELNADRLAEALRAIQRETGFQVEQGADGPYSVINGFYATNVRYANGAVVDVS